MRSVAIEDIAHHTDELVAEMEAGHRMTLVRAGQPIAEVVPCAKVPTQAEREAAFEELQKIFANARPLGIEWKGRDELYDRD